MESDLLKTQAALEKTHWWFVARQQILDRILHDLGLPKNARILEAGCGPGGNLQMLARHGEVFAFDVSATARDLAIESGCATVVDGSLPDRVPFAKRSFDLVVLFDVLEHIADDIAALVALRSCLKPGGRLLVTVPALSFLWSYHDDHHQHFRRYGKSDLQARLRDAGFRSLGVTYFNMLLFPLIAGKRILQRRKKCPPVNDLTMPPPRLNWVLRRVFSTERHLVRRIPLPVGISLLAVAKLE